MVLIVSCGRHKPWLQLLATKDINFPSASGIEFHQNSLYVFGDDAAYLLRLSPDYNVIDSFFFWPGSTGRLSKKEKHDIESAFLSESDNSSFLYGVSSMSDSLRKKVFVYNLQSRTMKDTSFFPNGVNPPSVQELNFEGSCKVGQTVILANRANLSHPVNHLIFLDKNGGSRVSKILLPKEKMVSGISGLYYLEEKDFLLFTASEEETGSAVLDGAIGDSYIGWIENFKSRMNALEFTPDQFIKLTEIDSVFRQQKIESICVERVEGNRLIVHLAADNDDGTSRFFKLSLSL